MIEYNEINKIFLQKANYYDEAIIAFDIYREFAYKTKLKLIIWICDFSYFTLLSSYDLFIIYIDYQKSQKVYQQCFYARQASLLCFELLSDISQHFNRMFNELFLDKITDEELSNISKELRSVFHKLKNENESKFKVIRDITSAHRDHDISKQIEIMNNMDVEMIMEFSFQYLKQIEVLQVLLNNTIKYIREDSERLNHDDFIVKYSANSS